MISIIIPTLNEASQIEACLNNLQSLRQANHEVIVVDGGSIDNTVSLAKPLSDHVLLSKAGRAIQMNSGARIASGKYLLFLHADTVLPENISALFNPITNKPDIWGHFKVHLTGRAWLFRVIEACMNLRSRLTGIATGDQAIFVEKTLFEKIKGFPEIEIMEDIAISTLLKKISKPVCFSENVISSSRRWESNGIIRTIIKMWTLRLLYFFNFEPQLLAKRYQ